MKRPLLILFLVTLCTILHAQENPTIRIETDHTALVLKVGKNLQLYQTYFGVKLIYSTEYEAVSKENTNRFSVNDGNPLIDLKHLAYPTFGTDNLFEPAIRMTHNDGNPSLDLQFQSQSVHQLSDNITETIVYLKDPQYPVEVRLHYKAFFQEDVIELWSEIQQQEKKEVTLYNFASSLLHFEAKSYWLTQFYSDWAEEARMEDSELTRGTKVIDSKLGVRADMFETPTFFLALNDKATENSGELLAGTIAWSGNFRFAFDVDNNHALRI